MLFLSHIIEEWKQMLKVGPKNASSFPPLLVSIQLHTKKCCDQSIVSVSCLLDDVIDDQCRAMETSIHFTSIVHSPTRTPASSSNVTDCAECWNDEFLRQTEFNLEESMIQDDTM
jgi:hypothetical protein